jgi:hypothetical protein
MIPPNVDSLWGMYQWLDRAPKGRNEDGDLWWKRHDEYEDKGAANVQRSTSNIQRRNQSSVAAIFINSLGCKARANAAQSPECREQITVTFLQMPSVASRDRASSSATPRASPVAARPHPSPIRRKTLPVLSAKRARTCPRAIRIPLPSRRQR